MRIDAFSGDENTDLYFVSDDLHVKLDFPRFHNPKRIHRLLHLQVHNCRQFQKFQKRMVLYITYSHFKLKFFGGIVEVFEFDDEQFVALGVVGHGELDFEIAAFEGFDDGHGVFFLFG